MKRNIDMSLMRSFFPLMLVVLIRMIINMDARERGITGVSKNVIDDLII